MLTYLHLNLIAISLMLPPFPRKGKRKKQQKKKVGYLEKKQGTV